MGQTPSSPLKKGSNPSETSHHFLTLPKVVYQEIFQYLDDDDLLALLLVNKKVNQLASDNKIWSYLYRKRWGELSPVPGVNTLNWRLHYVKRRFFQDPAIKQLIQQQKQESTEVTSLSPGSNSRKSKKNHHESIPAKAVLKGAEDNILSVCWNRTSNRLMAASKDGYLHFYDLAELILYQKLNSVGLSSRRTKSNTSSPSVMSSSTSQSSADSGIAVDLEHQIFSHHSDPSVLSSSSSSSSLKSSKKGNSLTRQLSHTKSTTSLLFSPRFTLSKSSSSNSGSGTSSSSNSSSSAPTSPQKSLTSSHSSSKTISSSKSSFSLVSREQSQSFSSPPTSLKNNINNNNYHDNQPNMNNNNNNNNNTPTTSPLSPSVISPTTKKLIGRTTSYRSLETMTNKRRSMIALPKHHNDNQMTSSILDNNNDSKSNSLTRSQGTQIAKALKKKSPRTSRTSSLREEEETNFHGPPAVTIQKMASFKLNSLFVINCAWSPSGNFAAAGGLDDTCTIYDVRNLLSRMSDSAPILHQLTGHTGYISDMVFVDDSAIITASNDKTCALWDIATGKQVIQFKGHKGDVLSLAVDMDHQVLFSSSADKTVKMWDFRSHNCVRDFIGHSSDVNDVCVSFQGKELVTAGEDGYSKVFDVKSATVRVEYREFVTFTSAAFSMFGDYAYVGGDQRFTVVWNTQNGQKVGMLGHDERLSCVSLSPSGQYLATGSWDQSIKIW